MPKLNRFYDLLHKCAHVTLLAEGGTIYEGEVKAIPDDLDGCAVSDFHMNDDGSLIFEVEVTK